jgi:prepilin-type N-terminal cleavage/methylation domain-containing protein
MKTNFRTKLKNQKGFNLIELMIVIAIIALLIGVGVPAWQTMQRSGNETAATQNLDTIRKLQIQYASKHQGNFAPTFDELIKSVQLDEKFKGENPVVNGFIYTMKVQESSGTQPAFYSINADPQQSEGLTATGTRHFYFDSTISTMKFTEENRPAKADDPSI